MTPDAASVPPITSSPRRNAWLFAAFVWCAIMLVTFRPPGDVVGGLLVPDAAEYLSTAQRLATTGHYGISINGRSWPSRYPPGWAMILSPAYFFVPDDLSSGAWIARVVWAAGCAAIASSLARRVGFGCALLVVGLVNAEPSTRDLAATPLADAPAVAVMLALLAVRAAGPVVTPRRALGVGLLIAFGAACRPLAIAFSLPFLIDLRFGPRRITRAFAVLLPPACIGLATFAYNRATFGSAGLNGYAFWCPMPYARIDYVFHPTYLLRTLQSIAGEVWLLATLIAGALGGVWIAWHEREIRRDYLAPLLWLALPVAAVHCFYFFFQPRLFLPVMVAGVTTLGIACATALSRRESTRGLAGALGVALLTVAFVQGLHRPGAELAKAKATLLADMALELPESCSVITFGDPVTFESIVNRGGRRRWVAASREQEYADKAYADHPIDLAGIPRPPPLEHRSSDLFARGAMDVVDKTADEDAVLDRLAADAETPTFVDRFTLLRVEPLEARLRQRFELTVEPNTRDLIRCTPRRTGR